ncbi:hypothetical protein GF312_21705 [Candidatus Poribacteria bacterium]|nr:hypothetical protein [Candidatus Poribacteria bacterium]
MNNKMANTVVEVCNELPFVNWDRFIDCGSSVLVFGWIDRDQDNYKDFITVEIFRRGHVEFTTSSAKYSQKISDIYVKHGRLFPGTHLPCQRFEDYDQLADVNNVIRIRNRQD